MRTARYVPSESRVRREAWSIAAEMSWTDPDLLVDSYWDPVEGDCLVLHKPWPGDATVVLGERTGVRIASSKGSALRLWQSVFAADTESVAAETIDFAVWAQGSAPIATSPAGAAYRAIATVMTFDGWFARNLWVRNRWERDPDGWDHLWPLEPYLTAAEVAVRDFEQLAAAGGPSRQSRWWLLMMQGGSQAVIDDETGTLHTTTGSHPLPQGVNVDGRKAIRETMFAWLNEHGW